MARKARVTKKARTTKKAPTSSPSAVAFHLIHPKGKDITKLEVAFEGGEMRVLGVLGAAKVRPSLAGQNHVALKAQIPRGRLPKKMRDALESLLDGAAQALCEENGLG